MTQVPNPHSASATAYFQAGLRAAQAGLPDQAAKAFEEAAWLDPGNAEVQFNLGTAYISMGLFEQATVNLSIAVKLKPEMPDAWGNRAVAHAALGEDDRSHADFNEAVRRGGNPDGLRAVIEYVKSRRKTPATAVPATAHDSVRERSRPFPPTQDVGEEQNHSLPLSEGESEGGGQR